MKTIILSFLACLSTLALFSQFNGNPQTAYHGQLEITFYDAPTEGTPYMNELYKTGKTTINGGSETSRPMRYNAFSDEMEFLSNQQKPLKLLKRENIVVELDGKTFEVHKYRYKGKYRRGYFNPLNSGEVVLFLQPKKRLLKATNPEHGYESMTPAKYEDDFEYYLKIGDNLFERIDLNKRELFYYLSDEASAVKKFVGENKLKLRKENEVVALLNYYNKIKSEKSKMDISPDGSTARP
ncbi:hypothetical protein [Poritiphilus flavus]|uniref:GLPGLI family protein n=1 Tax=Poritiphilus flavus TaxID=2697053 RepID=A0A6L9EGP3_9FLAO|nr:hypothetical protein [Poritiphilus flavus]NAS13802.1 hypothetical protein [Poritiphilus flavus]